jgi:hypothetical protein
MMKKGNTNKRKHRRKEKKKKPNENKKKVDSKKEEKKTYPSFHQAFLTYPAFSGVNSTSMNPAENCGTNSVRNDTPTGSTTCT